MPLTSIASNSKVYALVALTLAAPAGCNMARFAANQSAGMFKEASKSLDQEADLALAREAAPGLIKTIDGMALVSPHNETLLTLSAQAYCSYAFGFLEDDLEAMKPDDSRFEPLRRRTTALYKRCEEYGLSLLAEQNDAFPAAARKDAATLSAAVKKLDADAVPGLFWTGLALASQVNLNRDDMALVGDLPKVEIYMNRVVELKPDYYNGGAHLALGLVYSAQSKALGGNPEKGRQHLNEAIRLTGGRFLLNRVMLAHVYAVTIQDKALYQSTLTEVLKTPADVWPDQRLANEIAHKKAERYLKQTEDLF